MEHGKHMMTTEEMKKKHSSMMVSNDRHPMAGMGKMKKEMSKMNKK